MTGARSPGREMIVSISRIAGGLGRGSAAAGAPRTRRQQNRLSSATSIGVGGEHRRVRFTYIQNFNQDGRSVRGDTLRCRGGVRELTHGPAQR